MKSTSWSIYFVYSFEQTGNGYHEIRKLKTLGWPECAICPKSCYFYKPCATKKWVRVAQQKVLFWMSKSCDFATFEQKGCYCCYFWIKCQKQCNFKVFRCVNFQILPCGALVVFHLQYKHSGLHLSLPSIHWLLAMCPTWKKILAAHMALRKTTLASNW